MNKNLQLGNNEDVAFAKYALKNPIYIEKYIDNLYGNSEVDKAMSIFKRFYLKYKITPKLDDILLFLSDINLEKEFNKDNFKFIYDYDGQISDEYIKENIEKYYIEKGNSIIYAESIKEYKLALLEGCSNEVAVARQEKYFYKKQIHFDLDLGVSYFTPVTTLDNMEKITTTYKFMDNALMGNGYNKHSLVTYLGPSGKGKSVFLINDAVKYFLKGYKVVVFSLEMVDYEIIGRIQANLLNINQYDLLKLSPSEIADKFKEFESNFRNRSDLVAKLGDIQIKCKQGMSINEMKIYLNNLKKYKNFEPDIIIIDYLQIINSSDIKETLYEKFKNISNELREFGREYNSLIITAAQTIRGKEEDSDYGQDSVAESKAIVDSSDVVYAIIQTSAMYHDPQPSYRLKCLKARGGAKEKYASITVDYNKMRLTEQANTQYNI